MGYGMSAERLVLVQGVADTRATLRRWNANPWPVLWGWAGLSLATSLALLGAVLVVAHLQQPDPTPLGLPGLDYAPTLATASRILGRNLLVLALHSMACVAGFMAGASMPRLAAERTGLSRAVHAHAGRFAIVFVIGATTFSLCTQAYVLGSGASTLAAQHHATPELLLVALLPHALIELPALFLPLAAWVIASRRGEWNQLLAATFATTALALPLLMISALIEVYVSPHVLVALIGS